MKSQYLKINMVVLLGKGDGVSHKVDGVIDEDVVRRVVCFHLLPVVFEVGDCFSEVEGGKEAVRDFISVVLESDGEAKHGSNPAFGIDFDT